MLTEKTRIQRELAELREQQTQLQANQDQLIGYLGEHGALEDYGQLSKTLNDKRVLLHKLEGYENLLRGYQDKIEGLKQKLGESNLETNRYLDDFRPVAERDLAIFRGFSKQLYHNKPGGIEVTNNSGMNKKRFDMSVRIEDDTSDGINEVKIFCFDFTLLLARHNHQMQCLMHDSRLFSDMDPRQRATILKMAGEAAQQQDLQYIPSINEDMLDGVESYLNETDYQRLIGSRVLRLTDTSPAEKLLGIQINLNYEDA